MDHHATGDIDIEVMAWNDGAIAFYTALGFSLRYHGMRLRKSEKMT